jgi:mRNA-degrading endonuclease RelE of RelBE toxin-antitoxin system
LSEYRIFETSTFQRDLKKLGEAPERRLREALRRRLYPVLEATPRQAPAAARLRDWEQPTWRVRIVSWRILYEIDDAKRIVFLMAADHREDACC